MSHWSGAVANLEVYADWSKHRDARGHYHHLFGRYTYQGRPIFGKRSTPHGAPLDRLGRNIYVESLDSDCGAGWRRVNGFLSRSPRGQFCFEFGPKAGFTPRTGRSSANQYRALVAGPGVTPDVFVGVRGPRQRLRPRLGPADERPAAPARRQPRPRLRRPRRARRVAVSGRAASGRRRPRPP